MSYEAKQSDIRDAKFRGSDPAASDDDALLRFEVPASGTYMIKVGHYPAKKIVVIR